MEKSKPHRLPFLRALSGTRRGILFPVRVDLWGASVSLLNELLMGEVGIFIDGPLEE